MRTVPATILLTALLVLASCGDLKGQALAGPGSYVRAEQLVTATMGWALTTQRLARTNDAGATWVDITPGGVQAPAIRGQRFADATHGWLAVPGQTSAIPPGQTAVTVYRTVDGGQSWQSTSAGQTDFGGPGTAVFSSFDAQTGWLLVQLESGSNFSRANLFATSDGGVSWQKRAAPVFGKLTIVSATNGFLVGGATGDQLYRTSDGAATWQRLIVSPPPQHATNRTTFGAPVLFGQLGVLPAAFAGDDSPGVGVYGTTDGGATWTFASDLATTRTFNVNVLPRVSIVDARTWFIALPDATTVFATQDGGMHWQTITPVGLPTGVNDISFRSATTGWALSQYGSCLTPHANCSEFGVLSRTTNGGQTWTPVAP